MTTDAGRGWAPESLTDLLSDAASRLDALRAAIHLELRSAYWFGALADEVREEWEATVGPALADNAERLRDLSGRMGSARVI